MIFGMHIPCKILLSRFFRFFKIHKIFENIAVSTTPLHSGLVPLAPVGPPNSVRLSQACHGLMRQIRRFYAMEEKSHACETLEQRGFWLVDNALQ